MITRPTTLVLAVLLLVSTLGCGGAGMLPGVVEQVPRWACPTPTPLPYGEDGPVKSVEVISDGDRVITRTLHYDRYEQEYGDLGDPAPEPTAYTRSGTAWSLGQIVNLGDALDLQVDATAGQIQPDGRQLYILQTSWTNRGAPVPLQPARQLALQQLRTASGTETGPWRASDTALRAAGLISDTTVLSATLPRGTTVITVPVLAPPGAVEAVTVSFDPPGAQNPASANTLALQFTAGRDPHCAHPGTLAAHYRSPARPLVAPAPGIGAMPPGAPPTGTAAQIIAFAVAQADDNRPYCWGGKGWSACSGCDTTSGCVTPSCETQGRGKPCWDCSGLVTGAYAAAGITIRHGTSGQSTYPAVRMDQIQPADLLLYSAQPGGRAINHVMLYAGDLDGDGQGDAIQAYRYPDGTIFTGGVLTHPYWSARLVVITRPPRGGTA